MATIFRPPFIARRLARPKTWIPGSPILSTVGSAAGIATAAAVGAAIIAAVGSTAGAAAVAAVGHTIKPAVGSTAGVAVAAAVGANVRPAVGLAVGSSTASAFSENLHIISTRMIQKPVDYVLAGDQREFRQGRLRRGAMKHAFSE